jgi:Carboxypeptidase regulatory-like domain
LVLIVCSILLSWSLSQTKPDDSLSGQVTDSLTGRPIIGATLAVTDSTKNPHTVTTDAAGHYSVSSLPTGPATVTAKKTGYARASSSPTIAPGTNTQNEVLVPKKSPQPPATVPTK